MGYEIPILCYHAIGEPPSPAFRRYTVSFREFARQMTWLAAHAYTPVTLDDLLTARHSPGILPPRPIVLTFDDGFRDSVLHAAGILNHLGFTATFYLVAGLLGGASEWTRDRRQFTLPLVDAAAARQLSSAGFVIGSHTLTHPRLGQLEGWTLEAEIVESKRVLEDVIGQEVRHLAYPYGGHRPEVVNCVRTAGYATAVTTRPALASPEDDPLRIPRTIVRGDLGFFDWMAAVRTGCVLQEHCSSLARMRAACVTLATYLAFV